MIDFDIKKKLISGEIKDDRHLYILDNILYRLLFGFQANVDFRKYMGNEGTAVFTSVAYSFDDSKIDVYLILDNNTSIPINLWHTNNNFADEKHFFCEDFEEMKKDYDDEIVFHFVEPITI